MADPGGVATGPSPSNGSGKRRPRRPASVTGNAVVVGSVRNAARIDLEGAGAAGFFYLVGDYLQTANGVLNVEVGGPATVSQYDILYVTGTATLGGTLNISLIGRYVPNPGDYFLVLYAGARSGTFATINGLTISPTRALYPFYFDLGLLLFAYDT